MNLNIKQTIALDYWEDSQTTEQIFGGGAGGGKSILGAYCITKTALKYPATRWLIGRAKLKTLKETTLVSFFAVAQMQGLKVNKHYTYNQQSNTIRFFNGSEILLKDLFYYPSDPEFDELGSLEITGAFIDECNQITSKAWQIVQSRIRYKLDENNLIPKLIGTCNPAKNFVYKEFYKPNKENRLIDYRKFTQALATDNKFISKHYIENLSKLDEVSKQRLLYGNWEYDDDPSALFEYEKTVDLFTNQFVEGGLKYITCDVARLGKDKTIIRIWDGLRSIKKIKLATNRVDELVSMIKQLQSNYQVPTSHVVVDEDGVGGGVVDYLKCRGFVNNSRATSGNYANKRSRCYFTLATYVNENKIYLCDEDKDDRDSIVEELGLIKRKNFDMDGKLAIVGKEEIKATLKRSPDEADCIMMRMEFEVDKPKIYSPTQAFTIKTKR